jgi:hypothetical protein
MARRGKIGRLPHEIRLELNRRMRDGTEGKALVEWLNAQDVVATVMKEQFGGQPISESNLTHWRKGGYQEWLIREGASAFLRELTESDQPALKDPDEMLEALTACLAGRLAAAADEAEAGTADPVARWKRLRETVSTLLRARKRTLSSRWLAVAGGRPNVEG